MRALILSGGHGEGMYPLTRRFPKTMLYLHGKPIIHHVIESLLAIGIREFVITIGHLSDSIVEYFSKIDLDIDIKLVHQGDRKGVEGAILAAEKEIGEDEVFFLAYGDIIATKSFYEHTYKSWKETGTNGCMAVTLKGRTIDYGVALINETGQISSIKEHPEPNSDMGNYVVAGSCILPQSFWTYLNTHKQLDITISSMVKDGITINAAIWEKGWVDLAIPWDLLDANKLLFEDMKHSRIHKSAKISPNAVIEGPVIIERNVVIDNNVVIKGPCYFGEGSYIGNNCLIRNFAMISKNCKVGFTCEVKNAVIQPNTKIGRMSYIGDSILGQLIRTGAQITTMNEIGYDSKGKRKTIDVRGNLYEKLGCVIGDGAFIGANTVTQPVSIIEENEIIDPRSIVKGTFRKND